ncbi:MAG: DUF2934 domain-containing protein [Isosphaeraceae bacterium]
MNPTSEQIALAAYYRWQRRGSAHGLDRDDWDAATRDLTFGLNYRWLVRHALRPAPGATVGPILLGQAQAEAAGRSRRCRFCERAAPGAAFTTEPLAIPAWMGNETLIAWDECDECRAGHQAHLAAPFETFATPFLIDQPALPEPGCTVPVPALKALVRMGLAILPDNELHLFDDAMEWVSNPDTERDSALLAGLGCHVYITPVPVPAPFASLARRVDDDAAMPSMLFFLGHGRVVFQTHLPFSPRDEAIEELPDALRGPSLSMSLGQGDAHRSSQVAFLPVEITRLPITVRIATRAAGVGS